MLKKLLFAAFSAAAISGGSLANAATYNFVDLIDNNPNGVGEGTWDSKNDLGPIDSSGVWLVDGIGVSASASSVSNPGNAKAYLDGGGAGLGVCSSGINSSGECSTASDDNTGIAGDVGGTSTNFETLILTFTTAVKLDSLLFRDREHADHTTGFMLKINGVTWSHGDDFSLIGPAMIFEFARIEGADANKRDFYLDTATVTAVPLPAAAWLFGSALIGLAGVARKRKLS